MNRREIIRQIVRMIRDVDSDTVLKDILNLTYAVYRHYKAENWQ